MQHLYNAEFLLSEQELFPYFFVVVCFSSLSSLEDIFLLLIEREEGRGREKEGEVEVGRQRESH